MKRILTFLVLGLTACGGSTSIVPKTPIVQSLSINNVVLQDNFGFIVTEAQEILLKAEAQTNAELKRFSIYAKRGSGDYSQLVECINTTCEYAWPVSSINNGVYSFLIEAEDERGALSALPFKNSLAIDIR